MIVSAPASAALHVPVVSLAPSLDSQDSPASKTTAFKNVFDSLTLFEDLENGSGAQQQGAALPKLTAKKDPSGDSGSGTEEAVVPQAPSGTLPKPLLILQPAATLSLSTLVVGPETPDAGTVPTPTASTAPATGNTSSTAQTTASSASVVSDAPVPKPVLAQAAQPETASQADSVPTGKVTRTTAVAPPASSLQIRASAQAAQLSTNPAPQSDLVATATPASQAPVNNSSATQTPQASGARVPVSAPQTPSVKASVSNSSTTQTPQASGARVPVSAPQTPSVKASASNSSTAQSPKAIAPRIPAAVPQTPSVKALVKNSSATQTPQASAPRVPASAPETLSVKAAVNNSSTMASNFIAPKTPEASGTGIPASVPQTASAKAPVNNSSAMAPNLIAPQTPQATGPRIRPSAPQTPSVKAPINHSSAMASNLIAAQTPPRATGPRIRATAPLNNSILIATSLPESSSPQAAAPAQPAQSIQLAPPAPRQQPEAPSALPAEAAPRTTTAAESIVPASTLSPRAPEAVAAPTSLPAPLPAVREVIDRTSESSKPIVSELEALAVTPALKIPLLPEAENFAFALRMLGSDSSSVTPSETPVTPSEIPVTPTKGSVAQPQPSNLQQSPPPVNRTSSAPQRETPSSSPKTEPETEKPSVGVQNQSDLLKAPQTLKVMPHLNETAVFQAPEPGSLAPTSEPMEAAHPNLPLAVQEAHFIAPELPKTSASSEILLHLTGNDESSAAIRIADRAGSVNVSVHASDPVLRESLRSNLGELSTQLNAQGWKADVVKSAAAALAMHSESQQEPHANGQRSSQQQQSSGGERQPQRDRRANGGQWQQELDQQITGGDAHPGGNG